MSSRQFYIVLALSVISMKMQKLPSLVAGDLGKDGWLLFLCFTLINIIGIILVFVLTKKSSVERLLQPTRNQFLNFPRVCLMFFATIYFLSQALLVYEHIQGLFANTLFDDLSWSFFSLFLLFAVSYLAHRGVENISLNFELFVWIIVVSFAILTILGAVKCDYSTILPLETIDFKPVFSALKKYSCWFADFFLILFLSIKAREIKLSKTLLVYLSSMIFMTFLTIVFVGIYDKVAPLAPGLISTISEQSLLDLSIGRVDWFLILFTEMGAILACGLNLYFANLCIHSCFPKAKSIILKLINAATVYVLDVIILVDLNKKIQFFCGVMNTISLVVIGVTMAVLLALYIFNPKVPQDCIIINQKAATTQSKRKRAKSKSNKKSEAEI